MAADYNTVLSWIVRGLEMGADYVISICDTFDYDDYPVFVMPNEDHQAVVRKYNAKEMQRVNETIFLDDSFNDMVVEAKKIVLQRMAEKESPESEAIEEKIAEKVLELNDPGTQHANAMHNELPFHNGETITFRRDVEMDAKRARELTEQNILQDSNTIKVEIDSLIETAIKEKKFSISFKVPPAHEKEILKKHYCDLGFNWKQNQGGDQRDPYPPSITLSW